MPPTQESKVQSFPSSGTSESSLSIRVPPAPSQTTTLQSPAVWMAIGFPSAANEKPHCPPVQMRVLHSVSAPGQFGAGEPSSANFTSHCPLVQMRVEHGESSPGQSV